MHGPVLREAVALAPLTCVAVTVGPIVAFDEGRVDRPNPRIRA